MIQPEQESDPPHQLSSEPLLQGKNNQQNQNIQVQKEEMKKLENVLDPEINQQINLKRTDSLELKEEGEVGNDSLILYEDSDEEKQQKSPNKAFDFVKAIMDPSFLKNVFGVEIETQASFFRNKTWKKSKLKLTKEKIIMGDIIFDYAEIQAIKIYPGKSSSKSYNVLKLEINKMQHLISISHENKEKNIPVGFLTFAYIIDKKCTISGYKKVKWEKSYHISPEVIVDSYIFGQIYKQSQFFKKWDERYVVIKNDGLYSYKSSKKIEKHSFFIPKQSIKHIETNFEVLKDFLILKIKYGFNTTVFGIPFVDFLKKNPANWLFEFYRLIP